MLWLDGVNETNVEQPQRKPRLRRARAPTCAQLTQLAGTIARRVCRHLARKGWLEGQDESVFLTDSAGSDDGMDALRMSSITHRIATGKTCTSHGKASSPRGAPDQARWVEKKRYLISNRRPDVGQGRCVPSPLHPPFIAS